MEEEQRLLDMADKTFVVLGAGQGIGFACCQLFFAAGARLVCVDRDEALAEAAARPSGGLALAGDVTRRENVARIFSKAADWAGGELDGVVDIVGLADVRPVLDFDDDGFERQFDIVLRHVFLVIQEATPRLADPASLAFVSSMAGHRGVKNQAIYGAAKAALDQLVRTSAIELGPRRVRVNAVAPGFVRTPRLNAALGEAFWESLGDYVPLGAAAQPEEIASVLLFLSSRLASHVTGQVLPVDGGISGVAALPKIPLSGRATKSK